MALDESDHSFRWYLASGAAPFLFLPGPLWELLSENLDLFAAFAAFAIYVAVIYYFLGLVFRFDFASAFWRRLLFFGVILSNLVLYSVMKRRNLFPNLFPSAEVSELVVFMFLVFVAFTVSLLLVYTSTEEF